MMLNKFPRIFASLVFLLTFSFGFAESAFPAHNLKINSNSFSKEVSRQDLTVSPYKELNEAIEKVNIGSNNVRFNGTVLIGYQGKIIYENAFGDADRSIGRKNTLDTPTQVASITKTFTGTTIAWLQEKGMLDIHDPVQKYLWEFPYSNITIENLLAHQSGLPDYLKFSGRYWSSSEPMYNEEVLRQFSTYKFGLRFTPGSKFDYSNSNYAMLALIIEKVSGMPYKKFMNKYIFQPLHMENTFVFDPNDEPKFKIAKSYNANFNIWKNTHQDGVYGDKGIYTTAEDLFKWDQALYNNNFISENTKQDVFTPRRPWKFTKNYGLGWRIKTYPSGNKYAYHTGWWHGYQGIFSRYIKDEFTVVILSNRYISGISDNSELIYETASKYLPLTNLEESIETPDVKTQQEQVEALDDGIQIVYADIQP